LFWGFLAEQAEESCSGNQGFRGFLENKPKNPVQRIRVFGFLGEQTEESFSLVRVQGLGFSSVG
jgi:hypothetical protein